MTESLVGDFSPKIQLIQLALVLQVDESFVRQAVTSDEEPFKVLQLCKMSHALVSKL